MLCQGQGKDVDVFPFDPDQARPGWDEEMFDHPEYHLMTIGNKEVSKGEASLESLKQKARDRAVSEKGQEWEDRYGEAAWAAALALFGEADPNSPTVSVPKHGGPDRDIG